MPQHVAKMLAADQTVDTLALEAALDFLRGKAQKASLAGEPADITTYRNIMIMTLTINLRLNGPQSDQ